MYRRWWVIFLKFLRCCCESLMARDNSRAIVVAIPMKIERVLNRTFPYLLRVCNYVLEASLRYICVCVCVCVCGSWPGNWSCRKVASWIFALLFFDEEARSKYSHKASNHILVSARRKLAGPFFHLCSCYQRKLLHLSFSYVGTPCVHVCVCVCVCFSIFSTKEFSSYDGR